MGKIKFYWSIVSPPSRVVKLVLDILKIPADEVEIDVMNGGSRSPEYLKVNPEGKVPAIDDNGLILTESRAIIQYLVEKYGKDDSLYPRDLAARALVHSRLYFDNGSLWPLLHEVYGPLFYGEEVNPDSVKRVQENMQSVEGFLQKNKWIAGPNLTIADISFACIIAGLQPLFDFDISPYPKTVAWLKECSKSIPNYKLIEEGDRVLKIEMDKIPKKS
uniref:GSTd3 n=1 Tax=Liposcelis entomophila TaxID=550478 RepID=A0A1J0F586_9NEOP|nr:GSTd3 [Liposcelis entomophila]